MRLQAYLSDAPRGTAAALSQTLGVHPVLVSQWTSDDKPRPIPADRCPDIERATDGVVTCEEMRPEVRWVRVPDAAWPHPEGRPLIDVAKAEPAKDPAPLAEPAGVQG